MSATAVFCPEDPDGPLELEEALRLVRLMYQRTLQISADNGIVPERENPEVRKDRDSRFRHACGMNEALGWIDDVLQRVVVDASTTRTGLRSAAQELRRHAEDLERLAGE